MTWARRPLLLAALIGAALLAGTAGADHTGLHSDYQLANKAFLDNSAMINDAVGPLSDATAAAAAADSLLNLPYQTREGQALAQLYAIWNALMAQHDICIEIIKNSPQLGTAFGPYLTCITAVNTAILAISEQVRRITAMMGQNLPGTPAASGPNGLPLEFLKRLAAANKNMRYYEGLYQFGKGLRDVNDATDTLSSMSSFAGNLAKTGGYSSAKDLVDALAGPTINSDLKDVMGTYASFNLDVYELAPVFTQNVTLTTAGAHEP